MLVNSSLFALILYGTALILNVFDHSRSEIEKYTQNVKTFHEEVRFSTHYKEFLKDLLSSLKKVTSVDIVTITFFDDETDELYVVDSVGVEAKIIPRQSVNSGIVGFAFKSKMPILVQDVSKDKRYIGINSDIKSEYAKPFEYEGETIGVVNFESKEKDFFDDTTLIMIDVVFEHVVSVLRNAFERQDFEMFLRKKIDQYRENSLFIRGIAHELRNRMHAFTQLTSYLLKTDSTVWNFPLIKEQGKLQKDVVKYLTKNLNKAIETNTLYNLKLEDIKVGEFFNEVKNIMFVDLAKGLTTLTEKCDNNVDDYIMHTEKDFFTSIIVNILSNSIKAYKKSDAIGKNDEREIILQRTIIDNEKLFVVIEDMAGGIDVTVANKMSDPSKHTVGDKTGLNVIKRYIATLGGTVNYKNIEINDGKGTRVEVTIPISQPEEGV